MPIKQKWYTKGLFTQNMALCFDKKTLFCSYSIPQSMKDGKPMLSYKGILSHNKGNILIIIIIIIIEDPCVIHTKP